MAKPWTFRWRGPFYGPEDGAIDRAVDGMIEGFWQDTLNMLWPQPKKDLRRQTRDARWARKEAKDER